MDDLKDMEASLQNAILPWDRFSSWVQSICVVTFDLELGQAIESVYPGHVTLSEADKTSICYLAFPDSNSGVMGDSQFHFRLRLSPQQPSNSRTLKSARIHSEYNKKCPSSVAIDQNYLFGFAYFRQVKDSSIRRGYYQKSVILLTKLPLVNLFSQVNSVIARRFYDKGEISLEVACHDIDQWPLPVPGNTIDLPLLGHLMQVQLPSLSTRSVESGCETVSLTVSQGGNELFLPTTLGSFETVDLFTCLMPVVEYMHTLWELVLTAEPLVVMAPTPTLCSATVQHLTSIIYPFSFCADYRPFYTIHDSDFKDITSSNSNALPNIILGVTNPFFSKALKHWPHIVKLGDAGLNFGPGGPMSRSPAHKAKAKFKLDSKPGVYSQAKPFLEKDKGIVKRVLKGVQLKRPNAVQTALMRRHFLELTQTFMIPLERYLTSLMPLAKNISPYRAAPKVKPFCAEDFLKSLRESGPQLTCALKGDWEGLYRRFFKSPNFVGWYNNRHKEMSQKLQLLHLESLAESNILHWMDQKEEVQLVDMVLRIRNKLQGASDQSLPLPDVVCERLEKHVATILQALPTDLQSVLRDGKASLESTSVTKLPVPKAASNLSSSSGDLIERTKGEDI